MTKGNDMTAPKRILILGGTAEARALADRLAGRAEDVITSLAGRTSAPSLPEGKVRTGGFGGAEGLARYLAETAVTHLVDATHPFAARISANAVIAARAANVRLLRLDRPAWTPPADANWVDVPDMPAAARNIPENARVLLTIGRQELAAFHGVSDCTIFARVIEPPETVPTGWTIIAARGPFTIDQERALLETHAITHMVTKNSGSPYMAAKLEAAHALGVAVLMIARPRLPEAETAATIEDTLSWLSA